MKSGKQRRAEIKESRKRRLETKHVRTSGRRSKKPPAMAAPCNPSLLAPNNSYGDPPFVERGYYCDVEFTCGDCGKEEVWTATRQKWWYEVAKGDVWTTARRCNPCRRKERERKAEARRVHLEGVVRKQAQRASLWPRRT